MSLKYEDPDGDYITLSCQNDLNELFQSVILYKNTVVKVLVDECGQEKSSQRVLLSPTPTASAATLNPLPRSNHVSPPNNLTISPAAEFSHNNPVPTPSTSEPSVPQTNPDLYQQVSEKALRPIPSAIPVPSPTPSIHPIFAPSYPTPTPTPTQQHFTTPSETKIRWQR